LFVSQAVLIESADWREAQAISSRTVVGHWWRTAGTSALLGIVGTAVAPVLGIAFLVIFSPGIRYVNWFSSLLFAVTVPLSVIGMTLLYFELRQNRPAAEPVVEPQPYDPPAGVSTASGD
jgi:MFS family permease